LPPAQAHTTNGTLYIYTHTLLGFNTSDVSVGKPHDSVGTYEILKSFSFFVLFLAGCFIGTRNYSLQKCRSVDTAQNINYCVRIFYNTTENVQFRCVGINEEEIPGDASTQCCVNAVRAGLVDPQACTTRVTGGDGSFECHDPAAFEDLCRDVNSCPGDLVNSFQTAIILYAFTLFGFSLVAAARGYGLHAYSQFHYMDFFENRLNWFDVATFTCAKIGTRIEQWWLVLLNIPAFVWFSYYSQVAITDFCGNAVSEGGGTWELPVAANSWFAFSVVWATACMVTSTLLRYNYEVRPEIYDPQPGNVGCTFCGYRLDCHKSRAQSVCSSSAFCGEKCYDRTRVSLKHSLGRCCKNSCVPGKYLLWYPVWWLIYLSNVIFWLTCGPFGYLLEQWAAKKHWISV